MLSVFIWLRTQYSCVLLWTLWWTVGFCNRWEVSWLAEWHLTYKRRFCCMEFVILNLCLRGLPSCEHYFYLISFIHYLSVIYIFIYLLLNHSFLFSNDSDPCPGVWIPYSTTSSASSLPMKPCHLCQAILHCSIKLLHYERCILQWRLMKELLKGLQSSVMINS
jgi:hypothetical protein